MNLDTEAAHQSEPYDGYEEIDHFHSYTLDERRRFIAKKERNFRKSDKGKYVIAQTPRKNKNVVRVLYLVDRNKTKDYWWSHDASLAKVFDSYSEALLVSVKYKYNNCRVVEI